MNRRRQIVLLLLPCLIFVASCSSIDVFEKNINFKKHEWEASEKPAVRFNISDTASLYNIYLVLRHSDAYNFNNIWLTLSVQQPGDSAKKTSQYDLRLASNEKGWLGSGMDDIFEQRVLVQPRTKLKAGDYDVTLEHSMRQDPLQHVLSVGLRVEKVQQ
jgi:gliding motility-associated lipoprotein GldH